MRKLSDAALLFVEIWFLAIGSGLVPGGLFPVILSQELTSEALSYAVSALVIGLLMVFVGAVLAAYKFIKYN